MQGGPDRGQSHKDSILRPRDGYEGAPQRGDVQGISDRHRPKIYWRGEHARRYHPETRSPGRRLMRENYATFQWEQLARRQKIYVVAAAVLLVAIGAYALYDRWRLYSDVAE